MKLVIVESPAKAKTIEKYLKEIDKSGDFVVRASVGHVRDLPKSNKKAIDIEGGFIPHYEVVPGKQKVIHELRELSDKADEVILATDPDREGEAIAWHIGEELGLKKPERIVFNEITKEAIAEALANPRLIDQNLRYAQEARRVLDRLVGYDLSGLIWKKVRYGLSAGRVQSPALRILMEREREIRAFVPETFYVITADTKTHQGETLLLTCAEEPKKKSDVDKIIDAVKKDGLAVSDVSETASSRTTRPPFTTSTLQQAGSSRLGLSPSNTMRIAQKLYEAGHITYMRTDSVNLGKEAVTKMAGVVENLFGKEYLHVRVYTTTSKNAQEAHEAIRPTDPSHARAGATPDETQLYELIRTRALASQMAPARIMRSSVTAKADARIPFFTANGSRVLFPGWLALDTAARGEDVELPKLAVGDALALLSLGSEEKQTEPPNRYTEAGLIKELEKRGIGRPSTYASIMKTIADRGYVDKVGRSLQPTATGMVVSGWLEENFPTYVSDTFTAEMENELDEIARGERGYTETLKAFYGPFEKEVRAGDKLPKATSLGDAGAAFPCPLCGSPMENKLGRGGVFMSCKRYPECLGARTEKGLELKNDESIGVHPDTGANIYMKTGRFGPYVEMLEARSTKHEEPNKSKAPKKGKRGRPKIAAKRASIPAGTDLSSVTLADAVKYLSLPRELGHHPSTGKAVFSSTGRFGPYVGSDGEFRSLKAPAGGGSASGGKGDPYTITLDEALTILATPKKPPKGVEIVKEIGKHPRTSKQLVLYKSKQGLFLKKGLRRIYLPDTISPDSLTPADAAEYLK